MKYNILWRRLQICIGDQLEWRNWSCVKAWALNFRVPKFSQIRMTPGFKFSQIRTTPGSKVLQIRTTPGFKFSQIRNFRIWRHSAHHLPTALLRREFFKGELSLPQLLEYSFALLKIMVSNRWKFLSSQKKFFSLKEYLPPPRWCAGSCLIWLEFFLKKSDLDILKPVQFAACKSDFKCLDWILEYVWYRIRNFENAKRLTGPAG